MKKLTKKQTNEVCAAILEAKSHFMDKDPEREFTECICRNIGYYGQQIETLVNLIQHGYEDRFTFDQIKEIYDI